MAEEPSRNGQRTAEPHEPRAAPGAARPGLREALIVGTAVVVAVLAAAGATSLLPGELRDVVFRTPLLILVLIVGTGGVLWWITRPGRAAATGRTDSSAERSSERSIALTSDRTSDRTDVPHR